MILLDTDIIIEVLDKKSDKGESLMLKIIESGEGYCTSSVNLNEVLYCIDKYSIDSPLVLQIPTPGYSKDDSERSASLELTAERKSKSVPRIDAIIASVAINNGCSLYTLDEHFEVFKDSGLKLFG